MRETTQDRFYSANWVADTPWNALNTPRANRRDSRVALLFVDVDNFKVINDSLGHKAGDQLLKAVAERVRIYLRPEDTAARLGGDEFTILLEDITSVGEGVRIAERLARVLQPPFTLDSSWSPNYTNQQKRQ